MMGSSLPDSHAADESAGDAECAIAVAVLLGAGAVVAGLNGEIELGQVCGVLGMLLAVVAGSLWVAPRLSARSARRRAAEREGGGGPAPSREAAGDRRYTA